jgi:2-dehydro-3-deoxygluconokinase
MPELLCVGETMLLLTPVEAPLTSADHYTVGLAGAESNVAVHAAALGRDGAWASRVGDDPFGHRIVDELQARGVEVLVETDASAPTGIMFKDPDPDGSRVHYYRRGSAASLMDAGFVSAEAMRDVRIVHTSGVTPALSDSCERMVDALYDDARDAGCLVSFDVNDRRPLWPLEVAAATLARLADAADICFVGRDEAERLWGTATVDEIRTHLPHVDLLVVKDGAVGATAVRAGSPPVFVPAPIVEVVEPVGAGDAFAAGFLSALLAGDDDAACLSAGHEVAARALSTTHDIPPLEARP